MMLALGHAWQAPSIMQVCTKKSVLCNKSVLANCYFLLQSMNGIVMHVRASTLFPSRLLKTCYQTAILIGLEKNSIHQTSNKLALHHLQLSEKAQDRKTESGEVPSTV